MPTPRQSPLCVIIAGPNGAGKTTFAREFLPKEGGILNFVNADLIAAGISPLCPTNAALIAGRVFLTELDRLAAQKADFAFESTLSGPSISSELAKLRRRIPSSERRLVALRCQRPTTHSSGKAAMKSPALDSRTKAINAAMKRAAKVAAVRARSAGTKLYVLRNGKVVAETP